jgi:hypothetical protein
LPSLRFRPHHFLCTLSFQGKGYSPPFIKNYQSICDQLRAPDGDSIEIEVIEETDAICKPCPHRRGSLCTEQTKIEQLDQAHAKVLGIKPGDQLTWGEAKDRLRQRMSIATHLEICQGCEWLDHGDCRKALANLRDE